jgi:hypothetical protein
MVIYQQLRTQAAEEWGRLSGFRLLPSLPDSALGYRPPAPVAAFRSAAGALSQARAVI